MFWCPIHEAEKPSKYTVPVGVGDMCVSGTCGCRGHVGVGDMCAGGPVGVGDMWVWGTCGSGGHEGVGDLYSGGLVCLILKNGSNHKDRSTSLIK